MARFEDSFSVPVSYTHLEWTDKIARRTKAKVIRVGLGKGNDWRADKIRLDKNGVTFRVQTLKEEFCGEYRINLLGRHQVTNALLAIAVGEELGLSCDEIQRGLADCKPPKMRLQFWEAVSYTHLDAVVAKINLDGMNDIINVLSGRVETVLLLNKIREQYGDDPEKWLPIFYEEVKSL